ncbi:MAG: tRNA 4-thiouridine(8) synthase ThiI [Candidatus Aenigmatarchaeota archaeon]
MKVKALGLFSGGLDSILAVKLIQKQGIDVKLVNFTTPFFPPEKAIKMANQIKVPLKVIDITKDYLKLLKKPKYGYGSALNPCIDCKIFMLKKAKKYAKRIGAKFIFTGEVLGERPMSQTKNALTLIEKEAKLKGKLLRPLSAKLLPVTEAEKKWVDRNKLLDIQGRKRDKQIKLAKTFGIKNYPSPSGGCLLTNKEYAAKVKDLLTYKKTITINDLKLLKIGRHFRFKNNKIIVGRNKDENKELIKLKKSSDYIFEVPNVGSPITILQGPKSKKAIALAAQLTLRYSDAKEKAFVKYGKRNLTNSILIEKIKDSEINKLRITFSS